MGVAEKHTYDFGIASNSYFNGHDGYIERDDGKSIRVRFDDRCVSVNVKDHSFGVADALDDETKAKLKELNEHTGKHIMPWGDTGTYEDALYERVKEQWWHDAEWMTTEDPERPDWTTGVNSAGRSGGWCVIRGSEWLADHFYRGEYDERAHGDKEEYDEAITMRDEFLELAFNLVDNIDALKKSWGKELIDEDYAELEDKRNDNTVLSEN
jgi:hypothetical protein